MRTDEKGAAAAGGCDQWPYWLYGIAYCGIPYIGNGGMPGIIPYCIIACIPYCAGGIPPYMRAYSWAIIDGGGSSWLAWLASEKTLAREGDVWKSDASSSNCP